MSADLVAFVEARLQEDELWAKAASAARDPEDGTVEGGIHWTWAAGDQWDPVEPDPLEPYMGGYEGQWSQPVVLRSVEEWQLSWGGPGNTLPLKIAESEELRTADGAHIARHDPARVLRDVEAARKVIELFEYAEAAWFADRDKPNPPTVHLGGWTIAKAALMALAGSWSEHPDYSTDWAA